VGSKTEYQRAAETVAAYQEQCLRELLTHVADAIDRYRAGEVDAVAVDETIHQYHRATRELWKYCWASGGGSHTRMMASIIEERASSGEIIDWWEQGAPRR
jgi:hypothetical protein